MYKLLLLVLPVLAAVLSGCGTSSSSEPSSSPTANTYGAQWATLKKAAGNASARVLIPDGSPPDEVVIRDLKVGSGRQIREGDSFVVNFVDFNYATGELLEQQPEFAWTYAKGQIVKGWSAGLRGMRAGGHRELIVPSRLAYKTGPRVYLIELLKLG